MVYHFATFIVGRFSVFLFCIDVGRLMHIIETCSWTWEVYPQNDPFALHSYDAYTYILLMVVFRDVICHILPHFTHAHKKCGGGDWNGIDFVKCDAGPRVWGIAFGLFCVYIWHRSHAVDGEDTRHRSDGYRPRKDAACDGTVVRIRFNYWKYIHIIGLVPILTNTSQIMHNCR